jgi:hypothetical protein
VACQVEAENRYNIEKEFLEEKEIGENQLQVHMTFRFPLHASW